MDTNKDGRLTPEPRCHEESKIWGHWDNASGDRAFRIETVSLMPYGLILSLLSRL
jgi:hypothetical protein